MAVDGPQQGRLTAPVRSDQPGDRTVDDVESDIAHDDPTTDVQVNVDQFESVQQPGFAHQEGDAI